MTFSTFFRAAMAMLLLSIAASGQSKPQRLYQITGVLVSSSDGSPIPHGHLTPTLIGRGREAAQQFPAPIGTFGADEHGHFSVTLPSAGAWHLVVSARGYTTQAYKEHDRFSSAIVLTSEAPSIDLRFQLSPEADISGVVVDEAVEAVRKAQVTLVRVHPRGPDHKESATSTQAFTLTDDRGAYEFAGLPAGEYRICVQARPWYAVAAQERHNDGSAPLDPSLDVTYPVTWFPGGDDPSLAETLTMRGGDTVQADFHLQPIPSIHLRIIPPASTNLAQNARAAPFFPIIERVGSGAGSQGFAPVLTQRNSQGQIDATGLTPGLYQVGLAGPGQEGHTSLVQVTDAGVQTVDLGAASTLARVTIRVDGLRESETNGVHVSLVDPEAGPSVTQFRRGGGYSRIRQQEADKDQLVEVPPGRYEVVLQGRPNLFVTGVSAKGAATTGRLVTVPSGESSLTVHIADGRATLTGVASLQGKPSVGAMVLLVPTTIDDPGAIDILRRDQSNTDGSFDLAEIIPGQYILIAIDNGWQINWNDAATLRRYLMQGVPIDLKSGSTVKQNVITQAP